MQTVGFTSIQSGIERRVALTQPPSPEWYVKRKSQKKTVHIKGILTEAVKKRQKNSIGIRDTDGKVRVVNVPVGLMNDIVRPLWDREVQVVGRQQNDIIVLEQIEPTERNETADLDSAELVEVQRRLRSATPSRVLLHSCFRRGTLTSELWIKVYRPIALGAPLRYDPSHTCRVFSNRQCLNSSGGRFWMEAAKRRFVKQFTETISEAVYL